MSELTQESQDSSRSRRFRLLVAALALAFAAIVLAACSGDDDLVTVEDPWADPTKPDSDTTAFYVTILNSSGDADRLISAFSPRCGRTELHQTTIQDDVMSMDPADPFDLTVNDGDQLVLEPGGLHVMCIGVSEPFAEGEEISLELTFAQHGVIRVQAPVEQR
ncbi:MAG: copper chaperone PCu(A)C [Acidimicrobiales bacterium]